MTSQPETNHRADPETERDENQQPTADKDPVKTTEDPAANMDYEGDTPH